MPTRLLLGAHLSTSRGLPAVAQTARELGATCAQIFTSSPQQWRAKRYDPAEAEAFLAARGAEGVDPIVSHESYLVNLASADPALLEKSLQALREEIARCALLRLPMLVLHWGSYRGGTLEEGLARLVASLTALIPLADDGGVQLALETTAGQGAYLGGDLSQFPRLFDRIPAQERLGVCVDTAHAFAAGYDLRDADSYQRLWREVDRAVGLDRVKVIHLNDSARPLGSHGDRHAHIGQGEIGLEGFRLLMRDPRFAAVPKILETPGGEEQHADNLRVLRELAQ